MQLGEERLSSKIWQLCSPEGHTEPARAPLACVRDCIEPHSGNKVPEIIQYILVILVAPFGVLVLESIGTAVSQAAVAKSGV